MVKDKYILHSFGLFMILVIPFFINFPELALEVVEYKYFIKIFFIDIEGKVITNLIKEGIEKVMDYSN